MFKRLFFLSGVIAFILAVLTMWLWYLPRQEQEQKMEETELNQNHTEEVLSDTTSVQ